jgi:hypothetical protein
MGKDTLRRVNKIDPVKLKDKIFLNTPVSPKDVQDYLAVSLKNTMKQKNIPDKEINDLLNDFYGATVIEVDKNG